ncbi:MTAP family purine nucleoside phosphorylase [Pelotomaculum propionicicum]|uniref:S-methyl-5'-thioadenosine phosphorylase n=1 Tax=Pelotomaculum propionicicum TaxID=258475 RepID=A0A4Y7RW78_9FIRM|nr:MTAP family purine nucleoside phosphorylase [Pelotomaculum propionicicum]TEB12942.1 S-methyl-5'-thioadenosine phosphorylase [Pelotomaculum propionicicum]
MGARTIPRADIGFIGGSGTFSLEFPEKLDWGGVKIEATGLVCPTPFGEGPPLKLFTIAAGSPRTVLAARMHGRQPGVSWGEASRRLFWIFREAGVRKVVAEGGVGSVNYLLDPRDIVVPNDYIDFSMRRDTSIGEEYLSVMRQPICPSLHRALVGAAAENPLGRVFSRGIYLVTDGRHFESPAEMALFRQWGADIVGQTLSPEVYLAREIGACYAGMYLVVNYGEGIVKPWDYRLLKEIFFEDASAWGRIAIRALETLDLEAACECGSLRKPTLLRPENVKRWEELA